MRRVTILVTLVVAGLLAADAVSAAEIKVKLWQTHCSGAGAAAISATSG